MAIVCHSPAVYPAKHLRKCLLCSYTTNNNSHMAKHYRTHTGERPYKCDYCDRAFNNKSNMIRHMRIHTGKKLY